MKIVNVSIGIFLKNLTQKSVDVWMQERKEDGPLNGLWEFPGGKIEPNETAIDAVIREIHEEVEIEISTTKNHIKFFKLFLTTTKPKIMLNVFTIQNMPKTEKESGSYTLLFPKQRTYKIIPKRQHRSY
ncbi:MAG: NUDIX domain-containing protein [Bacteriovoracaceae bacterium]